MMMMMKEVEKNTKEKITFDHILCAMKKEEQEEEEEA